MSQTGQNQILDPPGSVIYTGEDTLEIMRDSFYIVYIEASEEALDRLKTQYFEHPKPLIWKNHFSRTPEQSDKEAVLASYPELLKARAKAYKKLANVTLPSEMILDPKTKIETIYEALKPPV